MPSCAYSSGGSECALRLGGNLRIGPISTGGEPGGAAGACANALFAGFCAGDDGEMVSGAARSGAIVLLPALAAVPAGLRLPAVFLRAFVESKPVLPAPEAGAKFVGGPSCAFDGVVTFLKVGGLDGSVCSFGVSGSGNWKAVCARAGQPRHAAAIGSAMSAAVLSHKIFRDERIANLRHLRAQRRGPARDRRTVVNGRKKGMVNG